MPVNQPQNPVRSALMMLGASMLFAVTTILAKALGQGLVGPVLHPFQVSAGRFGFAFLTILLVLAIKRPKFHQPDYKTHVFRTVTGWGGVTLMFTAVTLIPISDAMSISFLNPVIAMILAVIFLGEKVGQVRWLAAAIAFSGATLLLRPGLGSFQPAAFFALAAACFMGLEIVIIKSLSGREAPLQILTINHPLGFVIAITAASFVWIAPTFLQWIMLAGIGVVMVSGQALFIQSMRAADASFAAPFSYSVLVFATSYDLILFDTQLDWISILGGATILSGAILLAWREALVRNR